MLKRRAFVATLWSGGDIMLRQGLQFATTMVLARLLTPADFGVVAMLALFIGVAGVLADAGFSAALIQRQDVDHVDESTVFWCNLGIAVVLATIIWLAAPMIVRFYGVPVLAPLSRVMAVMVVASSLGAIHFALLTKKLDFRTQAKAGGIAALVSAVVAITMALQGFGVWALAAQSVSMSVATTALLWLLHRWRPGWRFSVRSMRKLAGFGGYHLGSMLMEIAYGRLYTLLIGRLFGAGPLGQYTNADNTRQIPGTFLGGVVARVALPMFAQANHDPSVLRRGMQLSIRGMMLINAPVMLFMAALGEPMIEVLFGRQWLPAASIFQVLCLAGVLYPLHMINLHALMAQGHARLMFRLEVIKKVLGVALLLIGAWYGVMGIAWSQVAFSIVALAMNTHYSAKLLGFGVFPQLRESAPSIIAAALVAAGIQTIAWVWVAPQFLKLVVLGSTGALAYLAIISIARLHALADVIALFRRAASASPP